MKVIKLDECIHIAVNLALVFTWLGARTCTNCPPGAEYVRSLLELSRKLYFKLHISTRPDLCHFHPCEIDL